MMTLKSGLIMTLFTMNTLIFNYDTKSNIAMHVGFG